MKKLLFVLTLTVMILTIVGCKTDPETPVDPIEKEATEAGLTVHSWTPPEGETVPKDHPELTADTPVVVFETEKGEIAMMLYHRSAPVTVENMKNLVESGYYDGLTFHRVEDVLIQGGDPSGDGTGGPGYTIPFEDSGWSHKTGAVGMARKASGLDTAGSQFYICTYPLPSLDGDYCVFGFVIEGIEVANNITIGDKIIKASLTTWDEYGE